MCDRPTRTWPETGMWEITPGKSASIRQPHWHRHLDVKRPTRLRAGIGSWPAALEAAGMSRHAKRKSSKLRRPKTKLGLPDLDHSKSAVLDSLRSPESKRGYRHAIDEFIQWYCSEPRLSFNKVVVTRYRIFLALLLDLAFKQ